MHDMNKRGHRFGKTMCVLAFTVLLAPAGCGYKDNPVPPQHVIPQAVLDLEVTLDDQGATLSWSYPRETVTGSAVEEVEGFELYRAEIPVDSYCPTCPVPYNASIPVPGGLMPTEGGKTATYEVKDLRPGHLYFFKVRSQSGWWRESKDSNEVSFFWQTPPRTPEGFTVTAGDGKNTVQWRAVTQLRDAKPTTAPIRYQLYRKVDNGTLNKVGEPLAAISYTDTKVENGRVYAYQVQALNMHPQGTVPSAMSVAVEAQPLDRTAPPVPVGVEGVRSEIGVRIYWDHVEAEDLAGYRVYRHPAGGSAPVLVGEVLLPFNIFIDAKAPAGPLTYSVTSIDRRKPANESARSALVQIEQ
jgi:hypothetical protein